MKTKTKIKIKRPQKEIRSINIPEFIMQAGLKPTYTMLLAVINEYTKNNEPCKETLAQLGERVNMTEPGVKTALEKLAREGYLRVEGRTFNRSLFIDYDNFKNLSEGTIAAR